MLLENLLGGFTNAAELGIHTSRLQAVKYKTGSSELTLLTEDGEGKKGNCEERVMGRFFHI